MASIGEMLRAAREAQGRSVTDLATELCITERYLRALEEDDIQTLPGLFFYQSFVRQYAAMLGIDAKRIDDGLIKAASVNSPAASQEAPAPFAAARTSDPSRAVSSSSLLRAANPSPGSALLERIAETAHRMSIGGYPAGLSTAALVAALVVGAGIFAWWNHAPQAGAPATLAKSKSGPAAANAALQNAAMQTQEDPNEVVLSLSANEETWVSIASHGKVLFSGILQPSESRTLKGGEVATMKIGNAGGVDIQLNGKSIGRVGPRGQVRTVRFTHGEFQVISPEEQPSDNQTEHDL